MPRPAPGSEQAVVRTVVWFLAAVSAICCAVRFTAKSNRMKLSFKSLSVDDWLVISALLFSIIQSVTIDVAVTNGLGQSIEKLSVEQLEDALKAIYASHFFYVFSLCSAKLSAVALLRSLTPKGRHRWLALGIGAVVSLWTFSSIFAMAFECSPPRTWDTARGKCFNMVSWWAYFEALNIASDVALVCLPIWIIVGINSTIVRKLKLFFPFALRVASIAACVVKLDLVVKAHSGPSVFTHFWPIALANAAIQTLDILPICTIYLKQFLDSLDAGLFPAGDYLQHREPAANRYAQSSETGSSRHLKPNMATDSFGRGQDAYVRLQEEGSIRRSSTPTEKDKDERGRQIPRAAVAAYRGRQKEEQGVRDIPLDQIEVHREVTIEEAPVEGATRTSRE